MKINLTRAELDAVHWAVGQHARANANSVREMMSEGMSRYQAAALNRAEYKITVALGYRVPRRAGEEAR